MDQSASRIKVEDIEAALAEVGEIKAARIVPDADGSIAEIHILALPTKAPKQLVRDIESTLMARFGIPVDHKKISIALLGRDALKDEAPVDARSTVARPRICSINATVSGVQASASVVLEIGDAEYVGNASGPASKTGRARLVALAALDAVSQYTDATISFALEDVAIVQLGREKVAVSCIALVSGFGEQHLSGSALVRQNDNDSIVRATLDAINRRMGFLTTV
ncbi:MAG: hypothetical protein HGB10_01935 [Coriobacteriia bacterium]|nr:hypothetical protein [Coriobacteriia bacterium]